MIGIKTKRNYLKGTNMIEIKKTKIVDKCVNCKKIDGEYCSVYVNPAAMWMTVGSCNMYTEIIRKSVEERKINPLKASKNKAKKKG